MIDTHCHLNFQAFEGKVEEVVLNAKKAGVQSIIVPGTDAVTSQKAVQLTDQHGEVYAAVGIHPHHIFEYQVGEYAQKQGGSKFTQDLKVIEELLGHEKVVAIGEVGVDCHYYKKTKYPEYQISQEFIGLQKEILTKQIQLAIKYHTSLILHNREAKKDLFEVLDAVWDDALSGRSVIHCCEPDADFIAFAKSHKSYIGVDGDVTYSKPKQEFIKQVPLEMLVLETDSPYLIPEPFKSKRIFPNEPANIPLIAAQVASLKGISQDEVASVTMYNAQALFNLPK